VSKRELEEGKQISHLAARKEEEDHNDNEEEEHGGDEVESDADPMIDKYTPTEMTCDRERGVWRIPYGPHN
jgi:hypothetical protein